MRSAEITDKLVEAIESGKYDFLRVNYPGGDMVGHFGEVEPTITAMEAIDISIKRIIEAVNKLGGVTVITADHGNAEELADENGTPKTSHTTNRVPCIFVDNTSNADKYQLAEGDFGIANIASTITLLAGEEPDPEWLPPIIDIK
jgi:2,3-bisphosphoglycerate-independent phosphoglycerate mutase